MAFAEKDAGSGPAAGNSSRLWLAGLCAATALFFLFLEWLHPYYFLEDDNLDSVLPVFAHLYRSLAGEGVIAQFNFHQFLGAPWLGASAALYPPVYLSVWFSKLFSGGPLWGPDVFSFLHMLAGAAGMFFFVRALTENSRAAFLAGLLWALNPFAVIVGVSWYCVWPVAALLPWLHLLAYETVTGAETGRALLLAAARLLLFYSGYGQYFVYAVLLEMVFAGTLLFRIAREKRARALKLYGISLALTAALSLPLLLPTLAQMRVSYARSAALAYEQFSSLSYRFSLWLLGLVWPFSDLHSLPPRLRAALAPHEVFADRFTPYFSHLGYAALFLLAVFFRGVRERLRRDAAALPLLVCAAVALLWAAGFFDRVVYLVPILNRFRWHFKLGVIANFYLITLACCALPALLDRFSGKGRRIVFAALLAVTAADFGALYTRDIGRGFVQRSEPKPSAEPLAGALVSGRIFSLGYVSGRDFAPASLGFNYATLWGLYHFAGYDPFVSKSNFEAACGLNYISAYCGPLRPNAVEYFRRWGVRWYVVKESETARYGPALGAYGIMPRFEEPRRTVYEDARALPLVYWRDTGKADGIEYKILTNRIVLETERAKPDELAVNFLYNPFFAAAIDARRVAVETDKHKGMFISVPPGRHKAVLEYSDPYFTIGLWLSGIFLLLAVLIWHYFAARHRVGAGSPPPK